MAKNNNNDNENGEIETAKTAFDLEKEFKEHSVAEFFKKNKQMLGLFGKVRTLTTVIHEYVTNSLDATEEAGILPDIEVKIKQLGEEHLEVTVTDNGPGLTQETVGKAFGQLLAGTKFHRLVQSRGQQGIGAAGATMLSQTTTGKPVKVITGTGKGKPISLEMTIDTKNNAPKISDLKHIEKNFRGTAICAQFKDVIYRESEQGALEYLRRTAIANPHAQITIIDPAGNKTVFKRTSKDIPKRPEEVKPHPKGITVDDLLSFAKISDARKTSSFLKSSFDRMGDKALEEIEKKVSFDLNKDPSKLTWNEAEEIIKLFKGMSFIAPRTDALRPIGEKRIEKSLKSIVEPEFLNVITRKPTIYRGGFPFQVEVAVAFGGNAGRESNETLEQGGNGRKIEIMRFANRAPLLFDGGGCAITKAVQTIEWKRYGIRDVENAPLTVLVNFISVHVPYTSAGKQAIADEEEGLEELRLALMDSGRRVSRYIIGQRKLEEKKMKREIFLKYIPEIAGALSKLTQEKEQLLSKKLEKLVLEKLKLDEQKEAAGEEVEEEIAEEEEADNGEE